MKMKLVSQFMCGGSFFIAGDMGGSGANMGGSGAKFACQWKT